MSLPGFRSLLTVLESGFESVGPVMGAVAFQLVRPTTCIGTFPFGTEPVLYPIYEQAVREAWRCALERLEAEAVANAAHGVVGVTASTEAMGGMYLTQVRLIGTAVRIAGEPLLARPFLSLLPMDETLKLMLRGWVPSGIAFGFSAIHVHGWAARPLAQKAFLTNAEMPALSTGMQIARERAEEDMRAALEISRAEGALASTISFDRTAQKCGNGNGVLIEGRILGTGVVRYREPAVSISAARNLTRREPQ